MMGSRKQEVDLFGNLIDKSKPVNLGFRHKQHEEHEKFDGGKSLLRS
jgi:hypothetical protein